jgi:hypothetical protein
MSQATKTLFSLSCDEGAGRAGFSDWLIGDAFAFYVGAAPEDAKGGRVRFLADSPQSLTAQGNTFDVTPRPWNTPPLESVTTDRDLYREGKDTVRLLVFAPAKANAEAEVALTLNGQALARVPVTLDAHGLGLYELPDPLAGEYTAHLGTSETQFTAAAFKLAPLTATLSESFIDRADGKETLRFSLGLETYGAPFTGTLSLSVMDLSASPPKAVAKATIAAINGGASGDVPLQGAGPFALQLQAADDAMKTATVPLPGSRQAERALMTLCAWGKTRHVASLLPFAGAAALRGVYIGQEPNPQPTAPIHLDRDGDQVTLRARADIEALSVAVLDPWTRERVVHVWADLDAGATVTLSLAAGAPWSLLLAGALSLGKAWEGRAALVQASDAAITLDAPARCAPGEAVTLSLRGPAGATAWVLVKDARLQTADTPLSAAAATMRRQAEAGLGLFADQDVQRTLDQLLPKPAPEPQWRGGGGVVFSGAPMPRMMAPPGAPVAAPMPGGAPMPAAAPAAAPLAAPSAFLALDMESGAPPDLGEADGGRVEVAPPAAQGPATRQRFPEVLFAKLVTLDAEGGAQVAVKMGDAMGQMAVEVFCVSGASWATTQGSVLVTRDVFGELVLPCFVRRGDYAEGRLFVSVAQGSGPATVTVRCDGLPVSLTSEQGYGEELVVGAPGATVTFGAQAGAYVAQVIAAAASDRCAGKVEEPGKLVWLQKALRMLLPGEEVRDDEPGVVCVKVMPSLDDTFDRMVGGLRSYEHCCCEQTSAVMLAAAAAYLTAKDDDTKRQAANHIRACVERERSMYLKGRGFKGWPNYPEEVFCFSPGATLNLLQMEMLSDLPLDRALKAAVDDCLVMARDAAKAHRIDTAPADPKSAREAYGRFGKFLDDRQRMASFIRERIEPWEKEMLAILKFDLPALTTETYHRTPAMIRAETAFGAATLIELGGPALVDGLRLANTVMAAVQENGSLYSTLDSVAAITLLTAMQRAGVGPGGDAACTLNGQPATVADALKAASVQSLRAHDAPIQVEVQRVVEEDYTAINQGVDARVTLERQGKPLGSSPRLCTGDAVDLVIDLKSGYEAGDLVHVFLPDALSWVQGGGQVKRFSLDLQGKTRLSIPLAATGLTLNAAGDPAPQRFAVCVRNMYDERRGFGTDSLGVTITAPDPNSPRGAQPPEGLGQRIIQGLKSLFSR